MTRSNGWIRAFETASARLFLALARTWPGKAAPASPPPDDRPVLIMKACCMGDAILSLYAIREFKRLHPALDLEMLVSSRISEVYLRAPEIARVHVLPVTGRRLWLELLDPRFWARLGSVLLRLRRRHFGQFVDLELYRAHGAIVKRVLGIPYSRGFRVEGAPPKGHDMEVDRPRRMPEWQCFYRIFGLDLPVALPTPLYPAAAPDSRRTDRGVRNPQRVRRIGVVFGSSFNWPQKKWPWEYFADTINLLAAPEFEFILLGSPFEREDARMILARAKGKVTDTTGTLDYAGLLREVAACDLLVGNDTGTLHLASACGVPTFTLFGPTDPDKWNGLTSTALYLDSVPCRPCYYLGSMPSCDHFSCLRKMQPAMVAGRIRGFFHPAAA